MSEALTTRKNSTKNSQKRFQTSVLTWFESHGRKDLPWQQNPTPYRVWVSEIMLQQTQVATAIPYYQAFMERFPTVKALASADQDDVLAHWSGLGYYARARNLHKSSQLIQNEHRGEIPDELDALVGLPGIGRSTAGAILSLGFKQYAPILDGNVKRVLARYAAIEGWPGKADVLKELWTLSETLTPKKDTHKYNQAMMDLGATLCTRTKPQCLLCPVEQHCQGRINGNPTDFPGKKPKKNTPVRNTIMLCLRNKAGGLLLYKRPPTGIWGGLWSLPEIAELEDIDAWLASEGFKRRGHKGEASELELARFRHTFSHFHLDIRAIELQVKDIDRRIMEANGHVWYKWGDFPGGIAAPVSKILTLVGESSVGETS